MTPAEDVARKIVKDGFGKEAAMLETDRDEVWRAACLACAKVAADMAAEDEATREDTKKAYAAYGVRNPDTAGWKALAGRDIAAALEKLAAAGPPKGGK